MLARILSFFLAFLATTTLSAAFLENKGQWPEHVIGSASFGQLSCFVEHGGMTFVLYNQHDLRKQHMFPDSAIDLRGHAFKMNWVGANTNIEAFWADTLGHPTHWLVGDFDRHIPNLRSFNQVTLTNVWPGIDLVFYANQDAFKYDYIVHPGADVAEIVIEFDGLDKVVQRGNELHLSTSYGTLVERIPLVYTVGADSRRSELNTCSTKLSGNRLSYTIDSPVLETLVIDPELIVATYVGASSQNSDAAVGFGADFFNDGSFIGTAGISGSGLIYPVTLGAFFGSSVSPNPKAGITRFDASGENILWSTIIGGNGFQEFPVGTFISDDYLYIFLSVEDASLPFTQPSLIVPNDSNINVRELFALVLPHDGSALLHSRLLSQIEDTVWGQIANGTGSPEFSIDCKPDSQGNLILLFNAQGTNVPITENAYDSENSSFFNNGDIDAVIMKLSPSLDSLHWCTFFGGDGRDYGFSLLVDELDRPIIAGTAFAQFIASSGNGYVPPTPFGGYSGFIARLTSDGTAIVQSTVFGFPIDIDTTTGGLSGEIIRFIDFDPAGNIWAYGYASSNASDVFISSEVYNNPTGRGFICKFSPDLSELLVSSRIGFDPELRYAPTAFMIDNCGYIYTSANSAPTNDGVTAGWITQAELTPDALFTQGGFYLAVYEPDMAGLHYATLMGGDHTNGGSSRFDKKGVVYQAVCVPPFDTGFEPTPNAHATAQSFVYELGLFKIDFESQAATAILSLGEDSQPGCLPYSVELINHSTEGSYAWFINGEPFITDDENPVVEFDEPGTYTVALSVFNPNTCNIEHTTERTIVVTQNEPLIADWLITEPDPCDPNGTAFSAAFTGQNADSIVWNAPDGSNSSETAFDFPISEPGTYSFELTAFDETCGTSQSLDYSFTYAPVSASAEGETTDPCTLPVVFSGAANASGGTPEWSVNGEVVGNGESFTTELPQGEHSVALTVSNDLCSTVVEVWEVTAQGTVSVSLPLSEVEVCLGDEVQIDAQLSQGTPLWSTADGSFVAPSLSFTPQTDQVIVFTATDPLSCNGADSASVAVTVVAQPVADFEVITALRPCEPEQEAIFTFTGANHQSTVWDLGDGSTVVEENPVHTYAQSGVYAVQLTVENPPCEPSTAEQEIVVEVSPGGANATLLPINIITPNGDGINDCLFFDQGGAPASNFQDFSLRVFNRWGTLVYEGSGIGARWCPNDLHEGSYVYVVSYTDRCTGEAIVVNQTVQVVR